MKTLICFGDSTVFGHGVPHDNCWVALLDGRCGYHTVNRGACGETTLDMLRRFSSQVLDPSPAAVLIMAGSNDLIFLDEPLRNTQNRLMYFLREAEGRGIRACLATLTPYVPPIMPEIAGDGLDAQRVCAMREELNAWIRRQPECLDCAEAIERLPAEEWTSCLLDGIHLNPRGHALLAEYLAKALTA